MLTRRNRLSVFSLLLAACASTIFVPQEAGAAPGKIAKLDIKHGSSAPAAIEMELGDPSVQLTLDVKPKKSTDTVKWSSSNPSAAIVTESGKVVAFGPGETVITAAAENGRASDAVVFRIGANGSAYRPDDTLPAHNDGTRNTVNDFLGVTHINPQYAFGDKDNVIEGAERLRELNTNSIKLYLSPNYKSFYQFTDWTGTDYRSPAELAQSEPFAAVFDMDFNTFFLGTFVFSEQKYATYWLDGFTEEQKMTEYRQYYDLAYHLLTAYEGTGKTFILQNWEGDWSAMAVPNPATDPTDEVLSRMTEWINIRQNAVNDARIAAGSRDVHVYNALEVNLVKKAMDGGKTVTNDVIPLTYCDYYSYSAYDTILLGEEAFGAALDYLQAKSQSNLAPGHSRIFVGEFGLPANEFGTKQVMKVLETVVDVSRAKQVDHVVHWQLYDNEAYPGRPVPVVSDEDVRGYWLIKPSGAKTAMWAYFYRLLHNGEEDPEYVPEPDGNYASLEIVLGAVNREKGLKQIQAADGMTTVATVGGVESRVTPGDNPNLYMYFAADHDYITPETTDVDITVTYFDRGFSPLVLEYNSRTNIASSRQISRTGTERWLTHTFQIRDASFSFGLGSVADFRFNDWNDPLYISKVTVAKPAPAGDRTAAIDLGGPQPVESGIASLALGDGTPVTTTIAGVDALRTDISAGLHNLYFDVDSAIIGKEQSRLLVTVTYFDRGTTGFVLRYNSSDPAGIPFPHSKNTEAVMFTNTDTWLTHTFAIEDAALDNALYGLVDFYLTSDADEIAIDKIQVTAPALERDSISVTLKANPIEEGISLKVLGYDGAVLPAVIGGRDALSTDPDNPNNPGRADNNYLYFDADDSFVPATQQELFVEVTYFDLGTTPFELQYNSTLPDEGPDYLGLAKPAAAPRTNTGEWLTHTFHLTDAEFANKLQNGFADFRLSDKGDKLYVGRIAIRKSPQ